MKTLKIVVVSLVSTVALAACDHPAKKQLNPEFGNSVRHNMAVHVINPNPPTAKMGAPDMDARRAGTALERYVTGGSTDQTKREEQSTSDIGRK